MPLEDQEDRFNDCYFIDKTHFLVATLKKFLVISSDFATKKMIKEVNDIHEEIYDMTCCSLDATETGFLISCSINEEAVDAYEDLFPCAVRHVLETKPSDSHAWLIKCVLTKTANSWELDHEDLKSKSLLVENARITSVLEFAEDQMLVAISDANLVVVHNWNQIRLV